MKWIKAKEQRPHISSAYVVKIIINSEFKSYSFIYVAYYDSATNVWHKFNPFIDNKIESEINDDIIEWLDYCPVLI